MTPPPNCPFGFQKIQNGESFWVIKCGLSKIFEFFANLKAIKLSKYFSGDRISLPKLFSRFCSSGGANPAPGPRRPAMRNCSLAGPFLDPQGTGIQPRSYLSEIKGAIGILSDFLKVILDTSAILSKKKISHLHEKARCQPAAFSPAPAIPPPQSTSFQ